MISKILKVLGLTIADFGLLWFVTSKINPDPSSSIGIIFLVPFVFILNVIIAGILLLFKRVDFSKLFLANSVIASMLMYYLFTYGINRYQNNRLESWIFIKADTTFSLIRWKNTNEFDMSYSIQPGSSWTILNGKCQQVNQDWILTAELFSLRIHNNKLIGFRTKSDTIQMKKIER